MRRPTRNERALWLAGKSRRIAFAVIETAEDVAAIMSDPNLGLQVALLQAAARGLVGKIAVYSIRAEPPPWALPPETVIMARGGR